MKIKAKEWIQLIEYITNIKVKSNKNEETISKLKEENLTWKNTWKIMN